MASSVTGSTGSAGPPPVAAGTLLAFRYRLGPRLAVGETAEIYGAQSEPPDVDLVVKLVRPALAGPDGGDLALRLAEQAETLRRVSHPGIVRLVADGWDDPLGARFVVLEALAGETLEARLARRPRLEVGEALEIAEALCEVLGAVHAQGFLHLDLAPAGIFLARPGASFPVKLAEVARHRAGEAAGRVPGDAAVLAYLAPERLRGLACDVRADVHALGAVLYRMLGTHPPFRGVTAEEVWEARRRGVSPLFAVGVSPGDEADRAARKCLADEPGERYATAAELGAVMRELRAKLPAGDAGGRGPARGGSGFADGD